MKFSTLIAITTAAGLAHANVVKRQHDHGGAPMPPPKATTSTPAAKATPDPMAGMSHGGAMPGMMPSMSHSGRRVKRQHDHGGAPPMPPVPTTPTTSPESMADMPGMSHSGNMPGMMPGMSHSGRRVKRQHDHGGAPMPPPKATTSTPAAKATPDPMAGMSHGGDMPGMMPGMSHSGRRVKRQHDHGGAPPMPAPKAATSTPAAKGTASPDLMAGMSHGGSMPGMSHDGMNMRR